MTTGFASRQGRIQSVDGDIAPATLGICDGHNHLWIERVGGVSDGQPVLDDFRAIEGELREYGLRGGRSILDCQPGGCGRNGNKLRALSRSSGIQVVACTGFHLPKYYAPEYWLFSADVRHATDYFVSEITIGLQECSDEVAPIRAGLVKIACQAHLGDTPIALLEAAAAAALQTGVAIEVHTEKGGEAEQILAFFQTQGLESGQLVLCHMDKRPDFELHRDLAQSGAVLEYDTFYRAKYEPEKHAWKLVEQMVCAGLGDHVVLATDMAEASMWTSMGWGPGLGGFVTLLLPRLQALGLEPRAIENLTGGNIARSLAMRTGQ